MFATYTHDASTSQANLVNDIVLILTGTTSAGSLSGDCVTGDTTIDTTYSSAGWTLFDASAGSNLQVIRALQQDGSTYKYVGIQASSTTSFRIIIYESWDDVTHTGINSVNSNSITWSSSTQQPFYIYASQQAIVISLQTTPASGTFNGPVVALECDNSLGTFISGYPTTFTWFSTNDTSIGAGPRIKNPNGVGDLTTSNTVFLNGINSDAAAGMFKGRIYRDGSETTHMALLTPVITATDSSSAAGANRGAFGKVLGGIKLGSAVLSPVTLDTVLIDSTTYIAMFIESGNSYLGTSLWVPKG